MGVVDDAFDFAAVEAEFAGYGPLAVTRVMPVPYRSHRPVPTPARVVRRGPGIGNLWLTWEPRCWHRAG